MQNKTSKPATCAFNATDSSCVLNSAFFSLFLDKNEVSAHKIPLTIALPTLNPPSSFPLLQTPL
jgi:hypothetical protein